MIHIRLIILSLFLSFPGLCQTFEEIEKMSDKDVKTFIEAQPQFCEVSDKGWINAVHANGSNQWNTGISVIHIGSFDDFISLENMLSINELQRETSQIKFFIVASSKFKYPKNEYVNFINRYNIALPVFIDSTDVLSTCLKNLPTPITLVISPDRHIVRTYHGLPDADKMVNEIRQIGTRLNDLYNIKSQPFLGRSPHQFSKSNLIECPAGIAIDEKNERIFVSDFCGNKVIGLSTDGSVLEVIGTGKPGNRSGEIHNVVLKGPRGLAYDDAHQKLYIADSRNNAIKVVDFITSEVTHLDTPDLLIYPTGIHLAEEILYITSPNSVWKMDIASEDVVQVAGFENPADTQDVLYQPSGITTMKEGTPVFSESLSSSIDYLENYEVTKSNSKPDHFGFKDGRKKKLAFAYPTGLAANGRDVIIADTYNNSIRSYNVFKQKAKTIAGAEVSGFVDGSGKKARFNQPTDLAILNNTAYITDTGNGVIRKLNLGTGKVSTLVISDYLRLCYSYAPNIEDFRSGDSIFVAEGYNSISIKLNLTDDYIIDNQGFSYVSMNSRNKRFKVIDDKLNDGTVEFQINLEVSESSVLIDFHLFFKSRSNPALKFKRSFSMLFPIIFQPGLNENDRVIHLDFNPDTKTTGF